MQVHYIVSIQALTPDEAIKKTAPNEGVVNHPKVVARSGAGTELEKLLKRIGLKPVAGCKCKSHIQKMNENIEWSEKNIPTIVDWLREEALRANLPFIETGAKLLIKRAISNAKKKQKGDHDMTVKLVVEINTDDVYDALTRTKPKEGKVIAATAEPPRPTPPQPPVAGKK